LSIIAALVVLSTGIGLAYVTLSHHYGATHVGLVLPSVLWLGRASFNRDDGYRATTLVDVLLYPLRRLDDLMGEDMQQWCDVRSQAVAGHPAWVPDAAEYYRRQVPARVKDERALRDLDRWRQSIEHKIKAARLADLDSPQRLREALNSHPSTRNSRKYQLGVYNLLIYPFRPATQPKCKRGQQNPRPTPSTRSTDGGSAGRPPPGRYLLSGAYWAVPNWAVKAASLRSRVTISSCTASGGWAPSTANIHSRPA
jgi:hypothetical protein